MSRPPPASGPTGRSVSVVIPTFSRPTLVPRAVRSALAQSRPPAEIIVVVDGETPQPSVTALAAITDPRVQVLVPGERLGNAAARNAGVARASGDWIALLDDDDVWMPEKLARQFETLGGPEPRGEANADGPATPIVSCRLIARDGARRFLWPRLLPRPEESIAHYLFCRRWPLSGDRLVQTSTLLAPRELFRAVPFRHGRRFVDQDWLLRCARHRRTRLLFPARGEALVEWDISGGRQRVSHYHDWRRSVGWARRRRQLLGGRAHAAFLLTLASASAADAGHSAAFWPLLREALREGRPNLAELVTHVAQFTLSRPLRDAIATRLSGWPRP